MQPVLLVFIDSFPFDYLDSARFLRSLPSRTRLTPSFGYSSINQVELLSGLTADELGYFGEWTYDPERSQLKRWRWLLRLAGPARNFYYLDRLGHRALAKFSRLDVKNIPFSIIGQFKQPYVSIFSEAFPFDSILKLPGVHGVYSYNFKHLPTHEVDKAVYSRACEVIGEMREDEHLAISMTKLDHIGHWSGVDDEYRNKIVELDRWIEDLYTRLRGRFPAAQLVVVSDHGMVNVTRGVRLDLEGKFGRPGANRYHYFLDGTMLRVWAANQTIRDEIKSYLDQLKIGQSLTIEDRARFGLTSAEFGDLIFVIDEPLMFVPCFWGGRISKGMHGYHPDNPSQHGIFVTTVPSAEADPKSLRNVEVYPRLRAMFDGKAQG